MSAELTWPWSGGRVPLELPLLQGQCEGAA